MTLAEQAAGGPGRRAPGGRGVLGAVALAAALWAAPAPAQDQPAQAQPQAQPRAQPLPRPGALAEAGTEELAWMAAAWAYFAGPPAAEGAAPPPFLAEARAGTNLATAWSIGDQVAALVIARRFGLIDARGFDERLSRLVDFLNWMQLAPDGMPNRFYDASGGGALGGDLQPGLAGWSAVDTGRLLLWLRIAALEHPGFAPFIRNAVARLSVCAVASPEGRLQAATLTPEGTAYAPETARGYDAVAAQGYRAWGLDIDLPEPEGRPAAEIEILGLRLPVEEDLAAQPPVTTVPPAYLGLELGFRPIGDTPEEVAAGRGAEELMALVRDLQLGRLAEEGIPTARADFARSEEPLALTGAVLAGGFPWSVVEPGGASRPDLALISTRAVFGLDAFFDDPEIGMLLSLVRELRDPAQGWFEGRYERTGAWERTRTSATNAFVLEALAWRHLGPLFPEAGRPAALVPPAPGPDGACRLPLAVQPPG